MRIRWGGLPRQSSNEPVRNDGSRDSSRRVTEITIRILKLRTLCCRSHSRAVLVTPAMPGVGVLRMYRCVPTKSRVARGMAAIRLVSLSRSVEVNSSWLCASRPSHWRKYAGCLGGRVHCPREPKRRAAARSGTRWPPPGHAILGGDRAWLEGTPRRSSGQLAGEVAGVRLMSKCSCPRRSNRVTLAAPASTCSAWSIAPLTAWFAPGAGINAPPCHASSVSISAYRRTAAIVNSRLILFTPFRASRSKRKSWVANALSSFPVP
jgi:hypothetical protein